MSNLTTKQKIILAIVVGAMLIVIGIYGYSTLHDEGEFVDIEGNEFIENSETSENSEIQGDMNTSNENLSKNERRKFKRYKFRR